MDETKGYSGGGFLLGLILGALAGAAAGLLWSPRAGSETRAKLAETLPGLGASAPGAAQQATDDLKTRIEDGREAFLEGAAEMRERMQRELDERRKG